MPRKPLTIMVIEDEVLLLEAIARKLRLSGINAISCTGGQQATDYLKSLPQPPNAIWLDYYLKDMDGLLFMQELQRRPAWREIPVVVVSNSANPAKVKGMLELGAKRYLLKAEHRLDEIIPIIADVAQQHMAQSYEYRNKEDK